MVTIEKTKSVADIVTERPNAALVFKKYQIDFCCNGNKPFEDVCKKRGFDPEELIKEINSLNRSEVNNDRFDAWNASFLCDYIVQNHHSYVRSTIPSLLMMSERVAQVHGEGMSSLIKLDQLFRVLAADLMKHLEKEENELFPLIKKSEQQGAFKKEEWDSLIDELKDEHSAAGELIHEIARITDNYNYPEWACNTFRALYYNLEAFQDDLFQHIHLENNVLFPKVLLNIK